MAGDGASFDPGLVVGKLDGLSGDIDRLYRVEVSHQIKSYHIRTHFAQCIKLSNRE